MLSDAGESDAVEVLGALRFNEFEGGFWSIELEAAIDGLGDHVVLAGYTPDAGFADGMRVRGRVRPQPDAIGFLMAGPQVDVLELAPA